MIGSLLLVIVSILESILYHDHLINNVLSHETVHRDEVQKTLL